MDVVNMGGSGVRDVSLLRKGVRAEAGGVQTRSASEGPDVQ